jgi:hypothetical protein
MKEKAIPRSLELKRVQPRDRANLTSLIFHLGELGLNGLLSTLGSPFAYLHYMHSPTMAPPALALS